jgi:hypothetical protein
MLRKFWLMVGVFVQCERGRTRPATKIAAGTTSSPFESPLMVRIRPISDQEQQEISGVAVHCLFYQSQAR